MTRSEDPSARAEADVAGLDALDGEQGPAAPLPDARLDALADRVLARLAARPPAGREPGRDRREGDVARVAPRGALAGRVGARRARWLTITAGATLATAAAALYATSWQGSAPEPGPRSAPRSDTTNPPAPGQPPAQRTDEASRPDGRPLEAAPPVSAPDAGGDAPGRARVESHRAADHLARANALREKRRYRAALERYLYVVSEYPGSMQSRAAQLAAAAIRLEQLGDRDGAEALYRAVKSDGDEELAAQAAFGLAEVARARADRAAEARALGEFLERHGTHPLAGPARRRLHALEQP